MSSGAGVVFRPLRADEAPGIARTARASFGATGDLDEAVERWRGLADAGVAWVLADREDDGLLAHSVLRVTDHWLGGRRVRCQHVGGVGVPPEHRAAGLASALMREAIRHGASEGAGLSLLFPATSALYRGLGWECAGTFTRWRLDARHAPGAGPALRALDGEWEAVEACQTRFVKTLSGPEARESWRWERLQERTTFAYGLDAADGLGLDGYVLVAHEAIADHWQHRLRLVDWAACTPRALQGVVGFVGRHGTTARDATFHAPTPNPWALLLAEQDLDRDGDFDWMARGLDLPAAVAARGFPDGLAGTVTLRVDDRLVEDARGPWRLEVAEGRGVLEPAAEAEVRLDATAVGPLCTGYRSASELARAGRAAGPEEALRRLDAAFAGSVPTLLDFF